MRLPLRVRWWWTIAALAAIASVAPAAQSIGKPASASGIYSAEQAERGARLFDDRCSACHTTEQFTGPQFILSWGGQPALGLYTLIRTTMPQGSPASLKRQEYADILAFLLRENGLPDGPGELPSTDAALKKTIIEIPKEPGREPAGSPPRVVCAVECQKER